MSLRPLLLLLDGHSSHFQIPLIKLARDENVIIFCLSPHITHASQPLDVGVYSPLKSHWCAACHQYVQKNPGKVVTNYQFCTLLNEAWMQTMKLSNMCGGFRRCVVYPFNPNYQEKDKNNKGNVLLLHNYTNVHMYNYVELQNQPTVLPQSAVLHNQPEQVFEITNTATL